MLFNLSPIISNILVCGEGGGSINGGCEFGVTVPCFSKIHAQKLVLNLMEVMNTGDLS
jgi:hypothetical protein